MKWFCLLLVSVISIGAGLASPTRTHLMQGLPLRFEASQSKVGEQYSARGMNYRLTLTAKESRLDWTDPEHGKTARIRTRLLNAGKTRLEPSDPLPGSVNYLVGSSDKWRTGVESFDAYMDANGGLVVTDAGNIRFVKIVV
jgi:hypothetical protein